MKEYAISVFALCLVSAVASLLRPSGDSVSRVAAMAIILWMTLSPIASFVRDFDPEALLPTEGESVDSDELSDIAEDALCQGIRRGVSEKFGIPTDSVSVTLTGFDMLNMKCDEIRIVLGGRAITADYKAIEKYVSSLGIGECEVDIEIG